MENAWTYSEEITSPFYPNLKKITVGIWSTTIDFKTKEHTVTAFVNIKDYSSIIPSSNRDFLYAEVQFKNTGRNTKLIDDGYYVRFFSYANTKRDAFAMLYKGAKYEIKHILLTMEHGEEWLKKCKKNHYTQEAFKLSLTNSKYIFPQTKRICSVVVSKIFDKFAELTGLPHEETFEIIKTVYRMYPKTRRSYADRISVVLHLMGLKKSLNPTDYNMIISDLKKYPVGYAKMICDNIDKVNSIEQYKTVCGAISPVIKKCKYLLSLNSDVLNYMEENKKYPKSRFQWYYYPLLIDNGYSLISKPIEVPERRDNRMHLISQTYYGISPEDYQKLFHADIELWHEYKKLKRIKGPYSLRKIIQVFDTLRDGARIYHYMKENAYGYKVFKLAGSPARMLRTAVFNHNQERKISIKELENKPNHPRYLMSEDFPKWMRDIELKDTKSVLIAGKECEHCIGSYAQDNSSYLVREGNICAQINKRTLEVEQCYDIKDTITKESKSLRLRLESSLKELKEKEPIYA